MIKKAVGRIILSYKDFQNLAGYSYLVNQLDDVLKEVNIKKFVKTESQEERLKNYLGGSVSIFIIKIVSRR